jgi:hypothetical protein
MPGHEEAGDESKDGQSAGDSGRRHAGHRNDNAMDESEDDEEEFSMRTRGLIASTMLATVLALPLSAEPAIAGDGDVERTGTCSRRSEWKLKLSPEDGGLEVEYEVDQSVRGAKWKVVLKHDGYRFFKGRRTTTPPSGSFEVRRVINNKNGRDGVTGWARNLRSGEVCRGAAQI